MKLKDLQDLGFSVTRRRDKLVVKPASKITPELRESIRTHRDSILGELPQVQPGRVRERSGRPESGSSCKIGPGTMLAGMIPDWAKKDSAGCGCKSYEKKMNKWGVSGCRANFDAIVEHLVKQKQYLSGPLKMAPDSLARAGARTLVNRAIKKAGG